MIVSTLVFSLGVGLQLATSWPIFILGRVVAGLGVGLISSLAPLYSGETSAKKLRGLVVGLYQWAITIGILIVSPPLWDCFAPLTPKPILHITTGCYR